MGSRRQGFTSGQRTTDITLGFVLILVNELTNVENTFLIRGNMIYYSLTKCKRVIRSVLASEIYSMVNGFDIGIAIATTLRMITERLSIAPVPLVICTNSYSLYECLINGEDNPADAFTKATLNRALKRFINSNKLTVQVEGWTSASELNLWEPKVR
ncbi:hypothetical protein BU23DRAFT_580194 [Bimuria novae-zelandiae CBS 107.79]|uniref:Uncharacterized protein n=1 Tax=Bimuria novae-zelandiae CBS 107.79 TaxID=1447943 RepID=A0A6A5V931_9PLEO|nr:hypothetical protein BU23DRAFT_580194 [Bimuria novae-zelandiae CBS 107.79]